MHKSLESTFRIIESDLESLIAELSVYPEELLSKKPSPNAWSVLEVLQHLMIAEKGSMAYVKKKTSYPDSLKNAGLADHYRKLRLHLFLHLPIKVKAPAVVGENQFDPNATFAGVVADWRAVRFEMKQFLDSVPDDWAQKLTYRHAFAGRMTFSGMLMFFNGHFHRHYKQIRRTIAAVE